MKNQEKSPLLKSSETFVILNHFHAKPARITLMLKMGLTKKGILSQPQPVLAILNLWSSQIAMIPFALSFVTYRNSRMSLPGQALEPGPRSSITLLPETSLT